MKPALLPALLLLATALAAADQPLTPIGFALGSETPAGAPLIGGQATRQEMGDTVAIGSDTLVVWSETRPPSPLSIYAAAVAPDGSRRHPNGVVIAERGGYYPSVATNGKLMIVTWADVLSSTFTVARVRPDLTLIDTRTFRGSAWPTVASNGNTFVVAYGTPGQRVEAMLLDENGEILATTRIGPGVVPKVASNGHEYAIASYFSGGGGNVAVLDAQASVISAYQLGAADVPSITACGRRFVVASQTLSHGVELIIVEGKTLVAVKSIAVERRAEWVGVASNGNDVLLAVDRYPALSGANDLIGVRVDPNGAQIGASFPIAAETDRYATPSASWNGSAYVVVWEWSNNAAVDPVLSIRFALVRSDDVVPPPVVSGAQLTTPAGSMLSAQGVIDDSARLAVWSESSGSVERARYRLGDRDGDLGVNATVFGVAAGSRFAVVWSSGGMTSLTLLGVDGTREDIALPFGEVTRAALAWDGSRFLVGAAGPAGLSIARVSAAGVLFDTAPRVLDARAASTVAVTAVKTQFIVAATTTGKRFLTYAIDGDSASILSQNEIPGPIIHDLAMTNDGTDAFLVTDAFGFARLSGATIVWERDLMSSFLSYGTPSVARIGNDFLATWTHSTAVRFDANGNRRQTSSSFSLVDSVVVQKPRGQAALLQRRFVLDPPLNGAWLFVFRDVTTVQPKRRAR